jgi:Na+-transporting methylmalonyl-CoA/oxaloacetate decarboxylase gamma subunit
MGENILINEKGVALIIALLMLLILTLIGISAISTTTFETYISGNERVGTDAFYASEAGIQIGLNQLPDTKPIPVTSIGKDSSCWSGSPLDKSSPQGLKSLGLYPPPIGTDPSIWECKRFQVNTTGSSFKATKEIEVQVRFGPFGAGTQYNN